MTPIYAALAMMYIIIGTRTLDVWNAVFRDSKAIFTVTFVALGLAFIWPLSLPIGLMVKRHRVV